MTMFITVCVIIVIGIVVAVVMDRIMRTHDTLHEACSRTRRGERWMSDHEKYDNRYKWLFVEVADEYCVQCPKCGYTAQVHVIKELVSGHYLSPHCPNCGEKMTDNKVT